MANQETKIIDGIIANRRAVLLGGGAALAALAMPSNAKAALNPTNTTDVDILNFALNLEYLEANFYYMAAFGCTIDTAGSNAAATSAGAAQQTINSGSTAGVTATTTGATAVPFRLAGVKAYAIETAIEEGKHVKFLQTAITQATGTYVAQPALNLTPTIFNTLATAAGVNAPALVTNGIFNPYASDTAFLAGAYIFEDVGVTAYGGAAPLISSAGIAAGYLQAAASIFAVEAYHAGLVRSNIYFIASADATNGTSTLAATQKISQFRATAAAALKPSGASFPQAGSATTDDFGLYPGTFPQETTAATATNPPALGTVSLAGLAGVSASNIADADPINVITYGRTTSQVLNIVTAGGATTANAKATGGFFTNGLNGTFA